MIAGNTDNFNNPWENTNTNPGQIALGAVNAYFAYKGCKFLVYHVHLRQSANKTAHSGFETQRRHQNSKTGVSVAPSFWLLLQANNLNRVV